MCIIAKLSKTKVIEPSYIEILRLEEDVMSLATLKNLEQHMI